MIPKASAFKHSKSIGQYVLSYPSLVVHLADYFGIGVIFLEGLFNNYVDGILPFFDPRPLRGQFYTQIVDQKQTPSPFFVHVVIEWPRTLITYAFAFLMFLHESDTNQLAAQMIPSR